VGPIHRQADVKRRTLLRIIKWADPPKSGGAPKPKPPTVGDDPDQWVTAELRARPGVWALVGRVATHSQACSVVNRINGGRSPAWAPAGLFEAVSRAADDGGRYVYACFKGGTE
jgi:hypothetical protein